MNAITKYEANLPAFAMPEAELMQVLRSSLYPGASDPSIKMAVGYCKAAGLDPMQKPVHIVPMWDGKAKQMRDVIMPGIGLYRVQAARNGCAGVSEPEFGEDVTEKIEGREITYPRWCRVTVKRRLSTGEIVEFTAREFWKENYAVKGGKDHSIAPNAMWAKRPYGQLAKCSESQALRKAFPEIGAQPTAEEMDGKEFSEAAVEIVQDVPVNVVRPRGDNPLADLPEEQQQPILDLADIVREQCDRGFVAEAFDNIDAANLDGDQKTALWDHLPASARSALKREQKARAEQATEAA